VVELCLFCNNSDKSYKPEKDKDVVCGLCFQLLLNADQALLKEAHAKCIARGFQRKILALEMFIIPEVKDGKRPKRDSDGKGADRFARHKKRIPRPTTAKAPASVL